MICSRPNDQYTIGGDIPTYKGSIIKTLLHPTLYYGGNHNIFNYILLLNVFNVIETYVL